MREAIIQNWQSDLANFELYYNARLHLHLNLQPDVQYFSNTGRGAGWAISLRWILSC